MSSKTLEFGEILETKENSDVVFIENGFPTHRPIIAAHSKSFKLLLLKNRFMEDEETEIPLHGSTKAFELLLAYLYTGKVELTEESLGTAMEVYELAHRYEVTQLEEKLRGELMSKFTVDSIFEFMNFIALFGLFELKAKFLEFIDENTQEILSHDIFLEVDEELFKEILTRQNLKATPCQKFEALYQWIENKKIDKSVIQKEVLDSINFSKLTINNIIKIVVPTDLCDSDLLPSKMPSKKSDLSESPVSLDLVNAPKCIVDKGEKGSRERCYPKPRKIFGMNSTWIINSIEIKFGSIKSGCIAVEISIDGLNWKEVFEKMAKDHVKIIRIFIAPQPVKYFRITGKAHLVVSITACYMKDLEFIDGVLVPSFNIKGPPFLRFTTPKRLRNGFPSILLRTDGEGKRLRLTQPFRLQYLRFKTDGCKRVVSRGLTVTVVGTNNTVVYTKYIKFDTGSYYFTFPSCVVTAFLFSMPLIGRGKIKIQLHSFETGN